LGETPPPTLDPRKAFEQFVSTLAAEDATSRLRSSIETGRAQLKTLGVPLPKATNPILVSLMESLKALPSNEVSARIAIVTALGRMGDPVVLPPLLLVTGAHSKDVRKATAIALGCIRHPLSAYLLLPMLQDGSSRVRQTAFQALIQLQQPHTMEAILVACSGSRSCRVLILETLRLISSSKRSHLFELLRESKADQHSELKIAADWLRFEFPDAIVETHPEQITNSAASEPQSAAETLPQQARLQQEKPVLQPVAAATDSNSSDSIILETAVHRSVPDVTVAADSSSSDSSIFGWDNAEKSQSTPTTTCNLQPATLFPRDNAEKSQSAPANGAASGRRYSTLAMAAAANESQAADRYEMTSDFDEDDDYESDVRLADDDRLVNDFNGSAVDQEFFNTISGPIEDTGYFDVDDDHSDLEFATNGSQTLMSLSGMLAAPENSRQSSGQMTRPVGQHSNQGYRPSELGGQTRHGSSASAQSQFPFSADETTTAMGNTPGLSTPLMLPRHPPAMQSNGTYEPAIHPGKMSAAPAFDMTTSSPLIPAFNGSASQPVDFTATTNAAGKIGSDVSSTVNHSGSGAGVTNIVLTGNDEQSIEEIEAAQALAAAAREKAMAGLSAARENAFRKLLEDSAEIPKALPRHLKNRVSALLATPSTNLDRVIEQLHDLGATNSPGALSTLASFSQKPAKQVREACAEAIGCIAHPGSAVLLLKLLADKSGTVVEAALKALIKLDLEPTRPVLFAAGLCGTSLRTVVTAGVESIADGKKSAWEAFLLEVLRGEDIHSTAFAVSLLARVAGDTQLKIFQKLASHEAPVLRVAAVDALARTQAKRAISRINEALEDADPTVRAQAAMSVATMYSPRSVELLQKLIFDGNLNVRRNAAQSMSRIDESKLADVIAKALDEETDATTVEYLLAALQRNGANSSLPILQRFIEGESSQFREQAVKALRKLKIPGSVPVFLRLLDDHVPALRRQAIEQLAVLKPDGVVPRLREMLKRDPNEIVRSACARALGDFGDGTSVHLLEESLEDHPLVRLQAVIALGRLGQASAGPILLSLMRDQLPEVRYQAVRAVAQLKLEGVEEQIASLLDDPEEMVRRGAEQSLKDLGQSIGTIRSKRLRKRFVSLASGLTPSSLAGAIPGGSKSLLLVIVAVMLVGGIWGFSKVSFVMAGGEKLPVGRVLNVGMSASTGTAFVLRIRAVMDVWSVSDGQLSARVKVPVSTYGIISEEKGGAILLMQNELGRLDPESKFSIDKMTTFKLSAQPSAIYYHQRSNSLCIFDNSESTTSLRVVDAATLEETKVFKLGVTFTGACVVSPDFSLALMVDPAGTLTLCQLETGEIVTASVSQISGQDQLGMIYSVTYTDDMKFVCFCTSTSFLAISVDDMQLVKQLSSTDGEIFTSAQAVPGGGDLVVMSASGRIYTFSNNFENVNESTIERTTRFDLSAMGAGGELVVLANSEEAEFEVYSITEQKMVLSVPGEE